MKVNVGGRVREAVGVGVGGLHEAVAMAERDTVLQVGVGRGLQVRLVVGVDCGLRDWDHVGPEGDGERVGEADREHVRVEEGEWVPERRRDGDGDVETESAEQLNDGLRLELRLRLKELVLVRWAVGVGLGVAVAVQLPWRLRERLGVPVSVRLIGAVLERDAEVVRVREPTGECERVRLCEAEEVLLGNME